MKVQGLFFLHKAFALSLFHTYHKCCSDSTLYSLCYLCQCQKSHNYDKVPSKDNFVILI